ncbi:glycosyltransferase [Niallia circulans]|uniref:glycosyltransferase n=1 Tax=Niallia circulans TaxID=1397 RepID=UPI002E2218E5|nr:glycosyltransferase [Niallia circulans]MED5099971.1 glycosyltransferase [Niallia circulans]
MKLLQITDYYNNGGGKERFIYDFSQKLLSYDIETAILCLEHNNTNSWGESLSCEVKEINRDWKKYIESFQPDVIFWHVGTETIDIMEELAEDFPVFSLVHNATCPSGTRVFRDNDETCTYKTGNLCMVNWYLRQCGTKKSPKEALNLYKKSKKVHQILNNSKFVYVATEAMKKSLEIEKIDSNKIILFDLTLGNLTDLGPIKISPSSDLLRILYIGRLSYNKGVQYLIQAISILKKEKINVICHIVGGGWYEEKLKVEVKKKRLEDSIHFIGQVNGSDVNKYYLNTDVVVVPSIWYEAAGLVVPEARKNGKPVVVFNSGGLGEWKNMMNNIFVADRADAFSLANTIKLASQKQVLELNDNKFNSPYTNLCTDLIEKIDDLNNKDIIKI